MGVGEETTRRADRAVTAILSACTVSSDSLPYRTDYTLVNGPGLALPRACHGRSIAAGVVAWRTSLGSNGPDRR
jgi:hypothetical protein